MTARAGRGSDQYVAPPTTEAFARRRRLTVCPSFLTMHYYVLPWYCESEGRWVLTWFEARGCDGRPLQVLWRYHCCGSRWEQRNKTHERFVPHKTGLCGVGLEKKMLQMEKCFHEKQKQKTNVEKRETSLTVLWVWEELRSPWEKSSSCWSSDRYSETIDVGNGFKF